MGFNIGSVFGSVVKALKPIAMSALQAASGPAINLLKNVVGSGFDGVKTAVQLGVSGALPGPLGDLAAKLLGKGVDALKNLATGGLEKGLQALVNKYLPRPLENGTNVTPTNLPGRGTTEAVASTSSAVNAAASTVTGGGWNGEASSAAASGRTPSVEDLKAKYISEGIKPEDAALMARQEQMQAYQRLIMMMTAIIQAKHEASKAVIQNFRV
jgi:hypothetical protein